MILSWPTMLGLSGDKEEKKGAVLENQIMVKRIWYLEILKEKSFPRHEEKK